MNIEQGRESRRRIRRRAALIGTLLIGLSAAVWAAAPPLDFAAFGSFKRMIHTGNTKGEVALSSLPASEGTWGVGALAGLRGELLLYDGRMLVSRGEDHKGGVSAPAPGDQAVLFAAASVKEWREVRIPSDLHEKAFEQFLLEQVKAQGFDRDTPFVFRVNGRFPDLVWHVVTGAGGGHGSPTAGHQAPTTGHQAPATAHGATAALQPSGHANSQSAMRLFEQPGASGRLVGIYSGAQLEGVVSHPGERMHVHYVDERLSVSGHVDRFSVAGGSLLLIPVR